MQDQRRSVQKVIATIERDHVNFDDRPLQRVSIGSMDAGESLMSNGPLDRHTEALSCSSARAKAPAWNTADLR